MGSQWSKDSTYTRAMREGYRSRAAYKLIEIQNRHHIIRETDNVVDLGAAPGSWLQVIRAITREKVLGIDISPIVPLEGVLTMVGDISDRQIRSAARAQLGIVNVVTSDASPKLSGSKSYDQARSIALCEESLSFACELLKPGGNFVVKAFQGEDFNGLLKETRDHFLSVRTLRSMASRKGSAEIYVIGKNFVSMHDPEGPI